ncbi:MAG: type III pantothenate kinase [Acidimicrobiales bacterium]
MLLCVDCGNTTTTVGMYPGADGAGELLDQWRIATNAERTADEHALLLDQLLGLVDLGLDDVRGVAIASTAPALTATLKEMCQRRLAGAALVVVEAGVRTGMPIRYDNPREVGPDRIANAVAAFDRYGGPTTVVDFGTATIFDAISAAGEYLGGAIFPGLDVSLDALFGRAAALRRVELAPPRNVIGRSVTESVQSGVVLGFASVVEGMCDRFDEAIGSEATVVFTGSAAALIAPVVDRPVHVEPWLTLAGLRLIYRRN